MAREVEQLSGFRIPYPGLDHHQKLIDSARDNIKYQWHRLITFAVILLTDIHTNMIDYITDSVVAEEWEIKMWSR